MSGRDLAGAYTPVRPDWLALLQEEAIEPGLAIVDAHHHLWDRPGFRYLLPDLLADTATGHDIVATVYVQSAEVMYRRGGPEHLRPVGEVEFANGVAAVAESGIYGSTRACAAIVGQADLRLGDAAEPVLEALLRAAPDRMRGVRQVTFWDPDERLRYKHGHVPAGILRDPGFRAGFGRLAGLGLCFDAMALHPQIADVLDLARAFPETPIALNHIGVPLAAAAYEGRREEVFPVWRASIEALGGCPNVTVKIGGLGMWFSGFGLSDLAEPAPSTRLAELWRPYVETCIEAFGTGRCMFESNFPVDKAAYSYPVVWNAFKRLAAGASADEKRDLFSGTAARFYRIELDDPARD